LRVGEESVISASTLRNFKNKSITKSGHKKEIIKFCAEINGLEK
jgi:hypothetical protein